MSKPSSSTSSSDTSTMWGGRFRSGPAEAMQRFNACLDDDRRLAFEDIEGSRAHAAMLVKVGILTDDEGRAIDRGLDQMAEEIREGSFVWDEALEDVHMNIEARLREIAGDAAGKLHTGRSRNDQVATDMRLWTRAALSRCEDAARDLQRSFLQQAEGHEAALIPGFTHLQIAQPITYGHWCLAYVEMLERDRGRLSDARQRLNVSPLGAAALAGTPHPIDREDTAKALGFDAPMANSLDAVSARDFAFEAISAASAAALHLSRLAEELVIFCTPQFGYLSMSDSFSTGSSIMPQKRNPDAAELLRGKSGAIFGALNAVAMQAKGLPLAYSKDLQETKRPLMDALDSLEQCLEISAQMIAAMTPNLDRMAEDAAKGFATATDLADRLAMEGLPFREAHHVVGTLVAMAEERNLMLHQLPLQDAQQVSSLVSQAMLDALDPAKSIRARKSYGAAQPEMVAEQLRRWREHLA